MAPSLHVNGRTDLIDMKRAAFTSIGRKIAVLVAVCVLMAVLTIASLLVFLQINDGINSKKSELEATGVVYAAAVADNLVVPDREKALGILSSIARVPGILFAVVLDSHNQAFASMGNTVFLATDVGSEEINHFSMLTKGILPVAVDIVRGGVKVGKLVLIADIHPMRTKLLWTILATFAAAVFASMLGIFIAQPMQRRIIAPILSLTEAMRHVKAARDYTTKVEHLGNDETGVMVETFNSMISQIRFRDASLERLAYLDPLTGLSNRQHFQKLIEELLADTSGESLSAALFIVDLDDFKQINDAFGHSIGDALLMNIAAILKQELGGDFNVARLGGDEFALIGRNITSEREAHDKLAPFVAALYQPVEIIGQDLHITASIGGVLMPRDGTSSSDLLRRADLALYGAKQSGPGHISFFRPEMDEEVQERAEMAKGLRQAITNGEFVTYFQPQFNLRDNRVLGFESLIRWNHPTRGLVPPAQFIPVAEETGLIGEIGNWILKDSCARGKAWLDAGNEPCEIAVNVSAAQILQASFFKDVRSALFETGFPPHLLCLELTESLFVGKSIDRVRITLNDLKSLGVLLALDDFGTGYSSLSYLEKLPFDILKIDRAFVNGIENDTKRRELLKGIISLAHTLGIEVVAEGAETEGELLHLRKLNADYVQGYVLSRPLPAAEALTQAVMLEKKLALITHSAKTKRA
jgi:diguanylate cyclase (GGDEF)-like protein